MGIKNIPLHLYIVYEEVYFFLPVTIKSTESKIAIKIIADRMGVM